MTQPTPQPEPARPEAAASELGTPLEESSELRVQLPVFEGPLDLLLYLIKKEEVDIYEVPLERITNQYLDYIRLMQMLNLELAGEFLVVASTLLYIKSRTLLPKDQQPPEEEAEEDDPRWELIRQLIEYKKFKDAAWQLHLRHLEAEKQFPRSARPERPEPAGDEPLGVGEVSLFDLISAFQKVLERVDEREDLREIFEDRWTVSDKITTIRNLLSARQKVRFTELFAGTASRTEVVVTFLALLELIRMNQLRATQTEAFDEIALEHVDQPENADQEVAEATPGAADFESIT
ncbi:MAG: segregation/condensation protein A [Verrucomicrobiota bacterium]